MIFIIIIVLITASTAFILGSIDGYIDANGKPIVSFKILNKTGRKIDTLTILCDKDSSISTTVTMSDILESAERDYSVISNGIGCIISATLENGTQTKPISHYWIAGEYSIKIKQK